MNVPLTKLRVLMAILVDVSVDNCNMIAWEAIMRIGTCEFRTFRKISGNAPIRDMWDMGSVFCIYLSFFVNGM